MTISQQFHTPLMPPARGLSPLSVALVADGLLGEENARLAEDIAILGGQRLADVLASNYGVAPLTIADAFSTLYQTTRVDPCEASPDLALLAEFGPSRSLQSGLLPWRKMGGNTVILTDKPDHFDRCVTDLTAQFGPVRMAITTRDQLETCVTTLCRDTLVIAAETKTPAAQSSRTWRANHALAFGVAVCVLLMCSLALFPKSTFSILTIWAIGVLLLNTGLKVMAAVACRRQKPTDQPNDIISARLPKITLLVPLFRETEIANHLLTRLREIDYPVELLDVCLVTESDDLTTRDAIGRTVLPTWMRSIIVPQGTLRTKPRALNYALDFAQGSIIGVYDAEDAPAPDQLRIVAAHFANRGPEVACLQGVLDFYNDSSNWLTRCFTIEYATWFRIVLPGLAQLGLVVPLGGTTLFSDAISSKT